jgi:hypothetical protein
MFSSAANYLWGSSSSNKDSKQEQTDKHSKHSSVRRHHSTASLPDIDALELKDEHNAQHSLSQLPRCSEQHLALSPLTEIILDKHSKTKISATTAIRFLFASDPAKQPQDILVTAPLYRYPFYIASNRDVKYVNKEDSEFHQIEATHDSPAAAIADLQLYLDSLKIEPEHQKGILELCDWIKTDDKLSMKLSSEMWLSEVIIAYFSSLSPTNPDIVGCWKKWIAYKHDHPLRNVSVSEIKRFFDSGVFAVGFDDERRPVWFINTEHYDSSFSTDVITKATTLWITSLLWNLRKNEFDLFALTRGVSAYVNLSHFNITSYSWSTIKSLKTAAVAYPFHLVNIYVSNIPTFMYLLKQFAAKVVVPHAMDKFVVLSDPSEYFEKFGQRHKTPVCAGGSLKLSATQWMQDRGYLDYIEQPQEH